MTRASDWFDELQKGSYGAPDGVNIAARQKRYAEFEDWARGANSDADTRYNDAMEVGGVEDVGSEGQRESGGREAAGRVADDGCRWSANLHGQDEGKARADREQRELELKRERQPSSL